MWGQRSGGGGPIPRMSTREKRRAKSFTSTSSRKTRYERTAAAGVPLARRQAGRGETPRTADVAHDLQVVMVVDGHEAQPLAPAEAAKERVPRAAAAGFQLPQPRRELPPLALDLFDPHDPHAAGAGRRRRRGPGLEVGHGACPAARYEACPEHDAAQEVDPRRR